MKLAGISLLILAAAAFACTLLIEEEPYKDVITHSVWFQIGSFRFDLPAIRVDRFGIARTYQSLSAVLAVGGIICLAAPRMFAKPK